MDHQTFTSGRSASRIRKTQRWIERLWLLGLLLGALLLFCINLGSLPLLNGGEKMLAQVAGEISRIPVGSWQWLYPTVDSQVYFEKPPLLYWLIAGVYQIANVNEWTTRLPGAILTAFSVSLLYGMGREIFPSRHSAIFSSLIYLTLFPVVLYGRLGMGDGATLCFVMLMMWCVLRSRRDFRWALGVGMGLGLLCLTKGVVLGVLLFAIALLFLAWDTPRLLTSGYWWLGWLLGLAPGLAWYSMPLLEGHTVTTTIVKQSLQSLWIPVKGYQENPWYYLVELVKFSGPWLVFWSYGLGLAWRNRNWGWAKLVLIWVGVYFAAISLMATKMSWSILPLYPALALAGGAQLAEVWNLPTSKSYPRIWTIGLSLMSLGALAGTVYLALEEGNYSWAVVSISLALTTAVSASLVARRDLQFILILFWGMYISLLLFMTSPHWSLEPLKAVPLESVAMFLKQNTPQYLQGIQYHHVLN
ncbi:MAG TPA: dolichyl-phosphate-mannose--protein mannosyltransferase [Cyanobacteria bacterium UBA11162]|nr:dolichyl-phosphate-mannose--protein mannosyltransferase [Cyanobacteria bacterium UBA11162]